MISTNTMTEKEIFERFGRTYWKEDQRYKNFEKSLYDNYFSFDECFEFSKYKDVLQFPNDEWIPKAKTEWNRLVNDWNEEENIKDKQNMAKGFVALTYLFAVLPYNLLQNKDVLSSIEGKMFNVIHFYVYSKYLNLNGSDNDLHYGPSHPAVYQSWINDRYDSASWFVSYFVYEKRNDLSPVFNQIFEN